MKIDEGIKLFGLQNLLLEEDLLRLEKDGIDLGRSQILKKDEIIDTEIFELDIRKQAKQMTGVYYLLFCLENSIRRNICDLLNEKYGATWWKNKVPKSVQTKVEGRIKDEMGRPFSERSSEAIYYCDFLDLIEIITENWIDFSDAFRSIESIKYTLEHINVLRRSVAHNASLEEDEILRFKLHIKDWLRIQM